MPSARGQGIHVLDYDAATGRLDRERVVRGIDSPAFLCLSPDERFLYAASEVPERAEGVVGAYAISSVEGSLTELGTQPMGGAWASYLTTDPQGRVLLLSDYGLGRVALLPIARDGSLERVASVHQHHGSGPDPGRQDASHAHCIVVAPDGRHVFAADLGADRVFGYRLDVEGRELVPQQDLALPPGAGPRHLVFAPGGRYAYLVCELDSTVVALAYRPREGAFAIIEAYPLLPRDFGGSNLAADVHCHPSGRFLYCSNRGHDSIAMFAIRGGGRLESLGHRSTEGAAPRNFTISPDGRFLLVANQDSDTIVSMPIEPETGLLGPSVAITKVPTPVCLVLART